MRSIATRLAQRPLAVRFLTCVLHGHRWDVAPRIASGHELACVRCGLGTDAIGGLNG